MSNVRGTEPLKGIVPDNITNGAGFLASSQDQKERVSALPRLYSRIFLLPAE